MIPAAPSPFTISTVQNVVLGYSKIFCFRCISGTVNIDLQLQINQISVCLLTKKQIQTPLATIDFSSSGPGIIYDYNTFFTPSAVDPLCSLTCELADTCGGGSLVDNAVSLQDSSFPWTIKGSQSIANGYDKTVCYRCTSQGIAYDQPIQIIQKPADCSGSLSPISDFKNDVEIPSSFEGSTFVVAESYDKIFKHSQQEFCKVNKCYLMKPGCLEQSSTTYLNLGQTPKYDLSA